MKPVLPQPAVVVELPPHIGALVKVAAALKETGSSTADTDGRADDGVEPAPPSAVTVTVNCAVTVTVSWVAQATSVPAPRRPVTVS